MALTRYPCHLQNLRRILCSRSAKHHRQFIVFAALRFCGDAPLSVTIQVNSRSTGVSMAFWRRKKDEFVSLGLGRAADDRTAEPLEAETQPAPATVAPIEPAKVSS